MSITEIQSTLAKRKTRLGMASSGAGQVSASDITVAVQKLGKLGGGFRIMQVGKSSMVVSVPAELDSDHMSIMAIASSCNADDDFDASSSSSNSAGTGITVDQVREATGWSRDRVNRALELLLQQGMAWLDEYHGIKYYWFPSIWQERKEEVAIKLQQQR